MINSAASLQAIHAVIGDLHISDLPISEPSRPGVGQMQESWNVCYAQHCLLTCGSIKPALQRMFLSVQIRAGTGGDEAALFCGDLLRMYQRYAETQSWKLSFLSESESENGGLKEAIVQVRFRTSHVNVVCTAQLL